MDCNGPPPISQVVESPMVINLQVFLIPMAIYIVHHHAMVQVIEN